jgi:N-acetylated-alpha-linked acidic dipeptidase
MTRFGDPDFAIHCAIGQWMSLILYHIADDVLIPWDLPNAATVLQSYLSELNQTVVESKYPDLDLTPLEDATSEFEHQAGHIAQQRLEIALYLRS